MKRPERANPRRQKVHPWLPGAEGSGGDGEELVICSQFLFGVIKLFSN